jgi:hypothetical protein
MILKYPLYTTALDVCFHYQPCEWAKNAPYKEWILQSKLLRVSDFTMQIFDTMWTFQTLGIADLVINLIFLQLQQWERYQQCMITKNLYAKHTLFLIFDGGKLLKVSNKIGKIISSFLPYYSHNSL